MGIEKMYSPSGSERFAMGYQVRWGDGMGGHDAHRRLRAPNLMDRGDAPHGTSKSMNPSPPTVEVQ